MALQGVYSSLVIRFGAQSRGWWLGIVKAATMAVPLFDGSGCRIRTDISSLVRAGVLPLDEP